MSAAADVTALLSALCFCPISLKIGGQRLGLILTFIEATKGKSGLRANNKTLETLSKLNQEKRKKGNLESILLYWFTIDQMYVPP